MKCDIYLYWKVYTIQKNTIQLILKFLPENPFTISNFSSKSPRMRRCMRENAQVLECFVIVFYVCGYLSHWCPSSVSPVNYWYYFVSSAVRIELSDLDVTTIVRRRGPKNFRLPAGTLGFESKTLPSDLICCEWILFGIFVVSWCRYTKVLGSDYLQDNLYSLYSMLYSRDLLLTLGRLSGSDKSLNG